MKLLINGACSVRGFVGGGWPDFVQQKENWDITNLSLVGSGFDYVLHTTIDAITKNTFDLVLVMWPQCDRVDVQVDNIDLFPNVRYSSHSRIKEAARLHKINQYIVAKESGINSKEIKYRNFNYEQFQSNWIFNSSLKLEKNTQVKNLFNHYLSSNFSQIKKQNLIKMICLQNTLKQKNQPYLFLPTRPYTGLHRFKDLYQLLDWDCVFQEVQLVTMAGQSGHYYNKRVVESPAHKVYADVLIQHIKKMSGNFTTGT
jgi:hypothetical protein